MRRMIRDLRLWAVLLLAIMAAGVAGYVWLEDSAPPGPPRAAIVDQLSLTVPNPAFVEDATATLEAGGYTVDYYAGEQVTVNFYQRLPALGYDLILFRVHMSQLEDEVWRGRQLDEASLFTSEPFTVQPYLDDLMNKRLIELSYYVGGEKFLGIAPEFIEERTDGDFDGATIIALGCNGLSSERMAQAFVARGAAAFISWDELVSASHNDLAGERLLELLVSEGLSPEEAAAQTMAELGPDPTYDSRLLAYP